MKFNFPLLKKCAFAVTLLSLAHIQGYADEDQPQNTQMELSQNVMNDSLTADTLFNALDTEDLTLDQFDGEELVARGHKKRNKRKKRRNRNHAVPEQFNPIAQNGTQSSWTPRFVWMGEVDNSEDLKCFATFLIGSLSGNNNMGVQGSDDSSDPGFFMAPDSEGGSNLRTSLNNDYIAQKQSPRQRAKQKEQKKKTKSSCPKARINLDLSAGPSFLFFTGYKADLMPKPAGLFLAQTGPGSQLPVKGRPRYNVTPLIEMSATFNLLKWLGFSAYLQSNPGYYISTQPYNKTSNRTTPIDYQGTPISGRFQSALDLNAVGGKIQLGFPNMVRFKTWAMGLFLSGGAGAGFQTWKNSIAYQTFEDPAQTYSLVNNNMVFNTEYVVNFSYVGDAAISFKSRRPYPMTLLKLGCKFIGWGQTRNIGTPRSPDYTYGYITPFQFDGIFSIVPYLGFTWSF